LSEWEKKSDQELASEANSGLHGQGAIATMMSRLKDAITDLDNSSSLQQEKMLKLTRWITALTWVTAGVGIIQIISLFLKGCAK
jgi:hypothetical protein